MVTCERSDTPHPKSERCDMPTEFTGEHTGQHSACTGCTECMQINSRRAVLMTRAMHHPEGLSSYEFTRGMTKADSLQFWVDAKALGFVGVGQTIRGARKFALPSYAVKS